MAEVKYLSSDDDAGVLCKAKSFLEYAGYLPTPTPNSPDSVTRFNFWYASFFFLFILTVGVAVAASTAASLNIFPLIKISTSQTPWN